MTCKGFRFGEGDPIEGNSCSATKDHKLPHDMYIYIYDMFVHNKHIKYHKVIEIEYEVCIS